MNILFLGLSLFFLAFLVHFIIWKVHLPKNHTIILLYIFIGILPCGIFILEVFKASNIFLDRLLFQTTCEYLHFSLFYISLALAYITTYSAIEVDSPTLLLAITIGKNKSEGVDIKIIDELTTKDELFVKPRIKDLVNARMIYIQQDRYKLTRKGTRLAAIFIFYRKLLNLNKGG